MSHPQRLGFLRPVLSFHEGGRRHVQPAFATQPANKRAPSSVLPQPAQLVAHVVHGKKKVLAENSIDHLSQPETVPKHVGRMPPHGRFHAEVPRAFERRATPDDRLRSGVKTFRCSTPVPEPAPYLGSEITPLTTGKRRPASVGRVPSIFDEARVSRESVERKGRASPSPRTGATIRRDASFGGATPTALWKDLPPARRPSPFRPGSALMAERLRQDADPHPCRKALERGPPSFVRHLLGKTTAPEPPAAKESRIQTTIKPFEPAFPSPRYQGPTKRHPLPMPMRSQILSAAQNGDSAGGRGDCLYDYRFICSGAARPEMAPSHSVPRGRPTTPLPQPLFDRSSKDDRTPRPSGRARTPVPESVVKAHDREGLIPLRGVRRYEHSYSSSLVFV